MQKVCVGNGGGNFGGGGGTVRTDTLDYEGGIGVTFPATCRRKLPEPVEHHFYHPSELQSCCNSSNNSSRIALPAKCMQARRDAAKAHYPEQAYCTESKLWHLIGSFEIRGDVFFCSLAQR